MIAAWEVIIYAGAIMVLFLFIIMMLEISPSSDPVRSAPGWAQWVPIFILAIALASCTLLLTGLDPVIAEGLPRWHASPRDFGYALFKEYALAIEIVSFQLLFAAVGAFYVGRLEQKKSQREGSS